MQSNHTNNMNVYYFTVPVPLGPVDIFQDQYYISIGFEMGNFGNQSYAHSKCLHVVFCCISHQKIETLVYLSSFGTKGKSKHSVMTVAVFLMQTDNITSIHDFKKCSPRTIFRVVRQQRALEGQPQPFRVEIKYLVWKNFDAHSCPLELH